MTIFTFFNKSPKLEILGVSNDFDYRNEEIKKIWGGNYLDIATTTNINMARQYPTYARFGENSIETHEFSCRNIIPYWESMPVGYNYRLHYNNIFSSLKAYLFDDIKNNYIWHTNCDIGDVNDREYMKSKGFVYLCGSYCDCY